MTTTTSTTEAPKSNLNPLFKPIAEAVKTMNRKGAGIYGGAIAFAHEQFNKGAATDVQMKGVFKEQEKVASAELRVKMGENSTYRVVKGLLIAARKAGISYVKPDGDFKGKTELEAELALLSPEKSALDKFKALMNSANAVADNLTDLEAITASALVNDLLTKVAAKIKAAA